MVTVAAVGKGRRKLQINGYTLSLVYANKDKETGSYGDIYSRLEDCLLEHPDEPVIAGFHLSGPGETPDWFDEMADAIEWASKKGAMSTQ